MKLEGELEIDDGITFYKLVSLIGNDEIDDLVAERISPATRLAKVIGKDKEIAEVDIAISIEVGGRVKIALAKVVSKDKEIAESDVFVAIKIARQAALDYKGCHRRFTPVVSRHKGDGHAPVGSGQDMQ